MDHVDARPAAAQHALARSARLGGGGIALCNLGALYVGEGRAALAKAVLKQSQSKVRAAAVARACEGGGEGARGGPPARVRVRCPAQPARTHWRVPT